MSLDVGEQIQETPDKNEISIDIFKFTNRIYEKIEDL